MRASARTTVCLGMLAAAQLALIWGMVDAHARLETAPAARRSQAYEGAHAQHVVLGFAGLGWQDSLRLGQLAWRAGILGRIKSFENRLKPSMPGLSLQNLTAKELKQPAYAQAAVVAHELCLVSLWRSQRRKSGLGDKPILAMGHSVGFLAALGAFGAMEPVDAVWLAAQRGKAFQNANQRRPGGLLAIHGLSHEQVRGRIESLIAPSEVLEVALDNGVTLGRRNKLTRQIVVGGDIDALDRLAGVLKHRAQRVAVDAACHTPLMADALHEAQRALEQVELRDPSIPLVGDDGLVYTRAAQIREKLSRLTPPVNWPAAMAAALRWLDGASPHLLQIGNGPLARLNAGLLSQQEVAGMSATYNPFPKK